MSRQPTAAIHRDVTSMLDCMLHERFYAKRIYSIPSLGCCLGVVSHDETFADCQVVTGKDRSQILVLAGEHFASDTDSSVEALFSTYGPDDDRFLRALNGWFVGFVIDLSRNRILLFNDRFGLGRVYYTTTDGSFAFSSEAKAILAVRPAARTLNPTALGQYFGVGTPLDNLTLFNDVSVMPGASLWSIDRTGQVSKRHYFTPDELESQPPLPPAEFRQRLRDTLVRTIPRYFGGPHAVAVSLTGGLDTRGIMAFAPKTEAGRSYTYRGMFREALDVRIARDVARACGYQHYVLPIGHRFLEEFPELAAKTVWTTDGTLDVGASHEIYLSRLAREIAPVRLTGNYGSEILRGVSTFKPIRLSFRLFDSDFLPYVEEGVRSLADAKRGHPVSFAAFKEIPWSLYGRLAAAQSQLTVRSPYTDNEVLSLAYRRPRDPRTQRPLWQELIADQSRALASIQTDRGLAEFEPWLNRRWDRLRKYLMFKGEWYYEAGMPSWLAYIDSRVGRGRIPPRFVNSHKIENYRLWFRDELFPWMRDLLCDSKAAYPYLDHRVVRRITMAHGAGAVNATTELTRLLTLELVHTTMIDGTARFGRSRSSNPIETLTLELDSVMG